MQDLIPASYGCCGMPLFLQDRNSHLYLNDEVSRKLSILENRNNTIYNFFYSNQQSSDKNFLRMFEDFKNKFKKSSDICYDNASIRWTRWIWTVKKSFLPNFYYEYFTEYGTYLTKMQEELKEYSEFLDKMELEIKEWAKCKNIKYIETKKDLNTDI